MNEQNIVEMLMDGFDYGNTVRTARTFEDAGVMTRNAGIVLRMSDGSEFQITIVQSKRAPSAPDWNAPGMEGCE